MNRSSPCLLENMYFLVFFADQGKLILTIYKKVKRKAMKSRILSKIYPVISFTLSILCI